jgi:hypothetical protein
MVFSGSLVTLRKKKKKNCPSDTRRKVAPASIGFIPIYAAHCIGSTCVGLLQNNISRIPGGASLTHDVNLLYDWHSGNFTNS